MAAIANPTTQNYVLFTFGGTMGTGADAEIWQCGLKLGTFTTTASSLKLDNLTAYLNSVATPLMTWWTTAANNLRPDYSLTWCKAANIKGGLLGVNNPGGKYDGATDFSGGPNPAVHTYTPTAGGGTGGAIVPEIITLCYTFRSSTAAKGKAGSHGRIYPPFSFGTNTSRAGSGSVTIAVTSAKNLLTALKVDNAAVGGGGTANVRPCLFGRDGSVHLIDQVSVGDVIDVQRRRKNKLREVYTTSAWS